MGISISEFGKNIWAWMFWGLIFWLLMELVPFSLAGLVLKKTPGELVAPYLAFAVPWVILAPPIWWLRKWEGSGVSPKRLAQGWGVSMVLFGIAVNFAVFYSGVQFHIIGLEDAIIYFVVATLISGPTGFLVMYLMALPRISARVAEKVSG